MHERILIERLVNELARPIYNYRMALPLIDRQDKMGKSARTRMRKAEEEIKEAVHTFAYDMEWT